MARSIHALAALAAVLLVPAQAAQSQSRQALPQGATILHTQGTPTQVELDLDTGRLVLLSSTKLASESSLSGGRPGTRNSGAQAALQLAFDNTVDDDCCLDALVYPAGQELFDWGIKSFGSSGFVERLVVGYSSRAVSTRSGGPGAAFTFRVFERGQGFGTVGRELLAVNLVGLPSSGLQVQVTPVMLNINLGSHSFHLPDGPLAWSLQNHDGDTGPMLVDVGRERGTQNYYDVYGRSRTGQRVYDGTFSLGPGGVSNDPWENSFWFQALENPQIGSGGLQVENQGRSPSLIERRIR